MLYYPRGGAGLTGFNFSFPQADPECSVLIKHSP